MKDDTKRHKVAKLLRKMEDCHPEALFCFFFGKIRIISPRFRCIGLLPGINGYAEKEVPQPQVSVALGLLKENPLLFSPSSQSISMPSR
jgi:hypothetical protein